MKNKLFSIMLFFILSISFTVFGEEIVIDDKGVNFDIIVDNGRTLVPLRSLSEELGANVSYNKGDIEIEYLTNLEEQNGNIKVMRILFKLDSRVYERNYEEYRSIMVNGTQLYLTGGTMDTSPVVINGVTYVPLRHVVEPLGYTISINDGIIYLKKNVLTMDYLDTIRHPY